MPVRCVHLERPGVRPTGKADVIYVPWRGQPVGHDRRFRRADTARDAVVAGELQTNDEFAPAGRAQRCDHFRHEPRAPVPVAAKLVIPPVRMWLEELMK